MNRTRTPDDGLIPCDTGTLWLQGPVMLARMYQTLFLLIPKLEPGAPIAPWTFLGRACGAWRDWCLCLSVGLPPLKRGRSGELGVGNKEVETLSW